MKQQNILISLRHHISDFEFIIRISSVDNPMKDRVLRDIRKFIDRLKSNDLEKIEIETFLSSYLRNHDSLREFVLGDPINFEKLDQIMNSLSIIKDKINLNE